MEQNLGKAAQGVCKNHRGFTEDSPGTTGNLQGYRTHFTENPVRARYGMDGTTMKGNS